MLFPNTNMAGKDNGKLCSILSYLLIGVIWYFVDKDLQKDQSVNFHVKQGIILIIFSIVWSIIINILFGFLFFGLIGFMWFFIHLLSYVPLIFVVLGMINALNGKQQELPIIGKFAEKLTF